MSVRIVIAANATAARLAAWKADAGNAGIPTAGTSGVSKAGSITETGNALTASATQLLP